MEEVQMLQGEAIRKWEGRRAGPEGVVCSSHGEHWRSRQQGRQAGIASTAKLILLRLRVEGRGRRGELRKIINPPNMGTKSDPSQDKITIPERKRSSLLSLFLPPLHLLLCSQQ
ncbi:unnamed protein product [Miscanthus lutarioriparius]|uniref:Uncharacterized protein n=1 Tax=Miscanthus lutarioriparius TaxID=422564 RepID=A0A811RHN6_9POAL|nr:unnamed protein product [Miscanthus lutarioriparius]